MKLHKNFKSTSLILLITIPALLFSQTSGDLAFIGFNADGDDDFAIVLLKDQPKNTIIYFSDKQPASATSLSGSEGTVEWSTGNTVLKSGTVVIFNDFDSGASRKVSIGALTDQIGRFNLSTNGDALFAYTGTINSVAVWLAGIQNGAGNEGDHFSDTSLVVGSTFVNFYSSGNSEAGFYNGSRSSNILYSDYLSFIGDSSKWERAAANIDGETLLPFSQEAFTTNTTIWLGASSNLWNSSANWDNGIPTSSSFAQIPITAETPNIAAGNSANAGNIAITEGTQITLNSGASLIITGTSNGAVTYHRDLEDHIDKLKAWYLVSSPVQGETMTNMRSNNSFITNEDNEISFASYDNTQTIATDRWSYFSDTATEDLITGKGYATKLAAPGFISFTGSMSTSNIFIPLSAAAENGGNNFNLIGNPFAAYINSHDFLSLNTAMLAQEEIYIWNQSTASYDTKISSIPHKIAPGQAFFVEAANTNIVQFSESLQSHESSDTFQKESKISIKIIMKDTINSRYADIYYAPERITGYENGYEGKLFGGTAHPFAIYTHLVSNSQGQDYQIQSLPNLNYATMVVPIGVNAAVDKEITFSTKTINLPPNLNIFLEDRPLNKFIALTQENDEYKVTLDTALNGIGRFYLHTSETSLKTDKANILKNISIYQRSQNSLRISGIPYLKADITIYNILGIKILEASFESKEIKDIELPRLKRGFYIIALKTKLGILHKKMILGS
jgi:hypothetical protein